MKARALSAAIFGIVFSVAATAMAGGGSTGGFGGGLRPGPGSTGGGGLGGGSTCGGGGSPGGLGPEVQAVAAPDPGDLGQITHVAAHTQTHTWGLWQSWQNLPAAWSVVVIPNFFPCANDQISAAAQDIDSAEKANPHGGCLRIRFDYDEVYQQQIINGNPVNALIARTRIGETITPMFLNANACGQNWDGL